VEPDDFEYEPTAHDEVLKRAQEHRAAIAAAEARGDLASEARLIEEGPGA
jgi:hypothetical protein